MSRALWLAPAAAIGVVLVASAGNASAHLETTNGCSGSGTFRDAGLSVDAEAIGDDVVTIPRGDTVDWEASVAASPGDYSGSIAVDLPPPFSELEIDSWSGTSASTSNSGARDYDFGSFVPAGVEFRVVGSHSDQNGVCDGYVNLQIKGGPFDSPVAPISLAATVVTGAGLFGTIRPLFRKVI
jgi:hypothetical protein